MLIKHSSVIKERDKYHFTGTSRLVDFFLLSQVPRFPNATLLLELGLEVMNPTLITC